MEKREGRGIQQHKAWDCELDGNDTAKEMTTTTLTSASAKSVIRSNSGEVGGSTGPVPGSGSGKMMSGMSGMDMLKDKLMSMSNTSTSSRPTFGISSMSKERRRQFVEGGGLWVLVVADTISLLLLRIWWILEEAADSSRDRARTMVVVNRLESFMVGYLGCDYWLGFWIMSSWFLGVVVHHFTPRLKKIKRFDF
jgi:hypothetical protein